VSSALSFFIQKKQGMPHPFPDCKGITDRSMYPEVFFGEKNRDSASLKMNNGTPGYTLARSGGITVALYALAATKKYTVDQLIQIARRVLSGTPCACQKSLF
jgi:hypothetical protein